MERVQKIISNYGYCSRRHAEELIKEGRVKVNGKVISIGGKASTDDEIRVDDNVIEKEKRVYIKFHKPLHCVTALSDPQYKTVIDYIDIKERIFPIGRLDYNTTGLLLLTNDGDFANQIMHPRYEVEKTYEVELDNPISDNEISKIITGVDLEDGVTSPAKVTKITSTKLKIIIHEGRNRIIRRIFETLGFKIKSLKRIQIGKYTLGNLKEGEYESFQIK